MGRHLHLQKLVFLVPQSHLIIITGKHISINIYINIRNLVFNSRNIPKTERITISLKLTLGLDGEEDLLTLLHGLHSLGKRRAEVT